MQARFAFDSCSSVDSKPRPGERCRILAILDVGNLGGRKCDDVKIRVVAIATVEDMKVPASCSHDDDIPAHSDPFLIFIGLESF